MENKINILYIISKLNQGGVQSFCINYVPILAANGVCVYFAVQTDEKQYYDDYIKEFGCKIFYITALNISKKKYFFDIIRILNENPEIKIIHSHQNFNNFYSLYAGLFKSIPVRISHSHSNYKSSSFISTIFRSLLKIILPIYATNYWACSASSAKWLFGKYSETKKCCIINNAINTNKYYFDLAKRREFREEHSISDNTIVMVHIGSFSETKNHSLLIDIFYSFLKTNKNSMLFLCGDGILRTEIEKKIGLLGISDNIKLVGNVSDCEKYLCGGDVFIFPSKFEGLPLSVIEAQATGIACVLSNAVSKEILFLSNSIICNSFCTSEWIESIKNVLSTPINRINAIEEIKKNNYDVNIEGVKMAKMYKKLLSKYENK